MTGRSNINSLNLFYTILFLLSAFAVCTVDATAACGIPSCRNCQTGTTTCTECDPFSGLTPGGASCESCRNQPYCSNCTVSTACTRCNNTKYAPDSSGVCRPCPANCDSCSVTGPTGCDRCSQGYTKSGSTCIQCAANCAVCNATGCIACMSGYSKINNVCTKCANNCTSCITNGAGLCDNGRCSAGFGIVTGQVCQACTGLRCRQCDNQGVTSGKCDSCIAPNVLQADNTCQFTCSITGCSDCTANPSFCTTCNAPLGVTPGGQCGPCGTGCARCNKTSLCLTCSMVDSEGPLMNGSSACAPCASDCFSCSVNGAGKCDTCDPGFRLTTTKTCEACTVTGCAKCPDATGTCTECLAGKVLSANTCINCDPHCDFCNVNGAGFCDPDYCQAGYTFDNGTKTCIGAPTTTTPPATTPPVCGSIAHCLDCHVDPNVCIMCDEPLGYGITATGKCDLCSTRTGCFRCHNLTQCTECTNPGTTGPSMDGSGTCLPCSANCGDCTISGAGKCNSCKTGYQLNSTQECASKNNTTAAPPVSQPPTTVPPTATPATTPPICGSIAHCLDCHVDPNVCIMCDEPLGYGITATGKCDLCSKQPGCFRCHNHTRCTECTNPGTTGPSMDGSGTCLPCSANCGDCTISGAGKCNSCKTGYQLNSTQECASKNNTTVAPPASQPANVTQAPSSPPNVTVTAPPPVTAGSIPPGQTGSVPLGTAGPASSVPPVTGGPASSVPPGTGGQTGGQTDSVPPGTGGPASSVPPGTGGPASSVPPGTGGPASSVPPGTGGPASSVPPVTRGETGGQTGPTVGVMTTTQGPGETTGSIGPATTSPAAVSSGASSSSPPASASSPGMSSPGPASVASSPGPASEASTPEVASTPAPPASTMVPVSTTSGGSGSSSNNNLWFLFIPAGVIALCALLCCCWYCFRGTGGPGFMPMPMGGAVRTRVAPPIIRTRVVRAAPEPQFRAAPKAYHRGAITGSPFVGLPR